MSLPVLYRVKRRADEKPFALTEICSKKHRLDEFSPPLSGGEPVTLDPQLLNDLRSSVPSTCLQKWKKLKLVDLKRSTTGSDDGEGAETSWMVDTVSLLDLTEPRRKSCKRFTTDEDENEDSIEDYIKQMCISADKRNNLEREITCNDVIMERTAVDDKFLWSRVDDYESLVFDYLFLPGNKESPVHAEEENLCYWEDEIDNNKDDEDSEDSNAENYYTNDYPEEDVEDELDEYYEREDVNRYSSSEEHEYYF